MGANGERARPARCGRRCFFSGPGQHSSYDTPQKEQSATGETNKISSTGSERNGVDFAVMNKVDVHFRQIGKLTAHRAD